jgi:5-hydroxyisourate hydrolase-like protein (transthyretin family)
MAPLVLARGKYTLRAAFTAQEWGEKFDEPRLRCLSNPVTFTIGDGPAEPSAGLPLTLQLEARVVGPDGKPVPLSDVSFWRAVDPTAVKEPARIPPSPFGETPSTWVDPITERTWELLYSLDRVEQVATMPGLSVGDYRVTAHVNAAPDFASNELSVGASGVIHLDGSKTKTAEVVRLDSGPSLTVDVLDAATGKPIPNALLRLFRPDGLPVVSWSGRWFVYARDGRVTYPHLAPGRYTLHVERRAEHFGDVNYADVPELVVIDVPAGRNTQVAVRLTPAPFDERETERRWPWVVTGKVIDAQGKPLEGVTIAAVCNAWQKVGLARTGKDGSYSLRLAGSGHTYDSDAQRWRTSSQPVEILPSMPGLCERNLARHGEIAIAEQPPPVNVGSRKPEEFLLPGQACQIDFVMVPAITLQGQLLDRAGNPVPNAQVNLYSDAVPRGAQPPSSVSSDPQGHFHFDGVPAGFVWRLSAYSRSDRVRAVLKSPSFALSTPGTYRLKVQRVAGDPGRDRLELISVTDPQGAEIRDTVIRPADAGSRK